MAYDMGTRFSPDDEFLIVDKKTGEEYPGCYADMLRDRFVFVAPLDYSTEPPGQDRPHRFFSREEVLTDRFIIKKME